MGRPEELVNVDPNDVGDWSFHIDCKDKAETYPVKQQSSAFPERKFLGILAIINLQVKSRINNRSTQSPAIAFPTSAVGVR